MRRKLIAGNWKMNGLVASGRGLARDLVGLLADEAPACDFLVCPPFHLLLAVGEDLAGSPVQLGAQDCHTAEKGAHTGDVSAAMLADAGCSHVIVGHSERRADHGESDSLVRAKAEAALAAGLIPIVCIGETEAERQAGEALAVVGAQLAGSVPEVKGGAESEIVVAYEPVWAIGSGRTPTPEDVGEVHGHIRALLCDRFGEDRGAAVRILYGGSVKAANAGELLAIGHVDGALVGGASLDANEFRAIGAACA
ncbi:MAG: triose-phosphate isomerase [Kiloniellales bacterium]|nr:triose-phosphate isomerase [Kiloniellales bacterium]